MVRIAPDELVFADARAWRDIMGHRSAGQPEMEKSPKAYQTIKGQPPTLISAGREEHGRVRRQLAHGFSERSMRAQQPIIMEYINLLIKRLRENCDGGKAKLDMVKCKCVYFISSSLFFSLFEKPSSRRACGTRVNKN